MSSDQTNVAAQVTIAAERGVQHRHKQRRFLELLGTTVALVASIAAGLGGFLITRSGPTRPPAEVYANEVERLIASSEANAAQLRNVLIELRKNQELVDEITKATPATLRVARLSTELDSLQAQMMQLDDAIGQSPEKALAIPLLKKDVEDFKDTYRHDMDSTQGEINRVYDQNKWFIGLMFTLALGILGLTVTNFLQVRKQ